VISQTLSGLLPLLFVLFNQIGNAADTSISIPGFDGNLTIQNVRIVASERLVFTVVNNTGEEWRTLRLNFDIEDNCTGKVRQWSSVVYQYTRWSTGTPSVAEINSNFDAQTLFEGVCPEATFKVKLLVAESARWKIDAVSGIRVDKEESKREALETAKAKERSYPFSVPGIVGNITVLTPTLGAIGRPFHFSLMNNTSSAWTSVRVRFDMTGICDGKARQDSFIIASRTLGWDKNEAVVQPVDSYEAVKRLGSLGRECESVNIKPTLLSVENDKGRVDGKTGTRVDRAAQAGTSSRTRNATPEFRAVGGLEEERQEKSDAEAAQVRRNCVAIYVLTADKKVTDLTVRETEQIKACRFLDLYPPR
jgi:hypothetical protein